MLSNLSNQAFNRLCVDNPSILTFSWKHSRYHFVGAPFGIKTIPSLFQKIMDRLFGDCKHFVLCYLDDITVFSSSVELHLQQVNEVISRLNNANLKIKIKKTNIGMKKIRLLGHIIGNNSSSIDVVKLIALEDYSLPQTRGGAGMTWPEKACFKPFFWC
jgi:hypothetical protein